MSNPFPWHQYTKKCRLRIVQPRNVGHFTAEEAGKRKMHLAIGKSGSFAEGNMVVFYWLVDPVDGMIVDALFQHFGDAIAIAIADVTVELLIGKNYHQAHHITAELIDKQLRDKKEEMACEEKSRMHLNRMLEAIDMAASQCKEIPLPSSYTTPFSRSNEKGSIYSGWDGLTKEEKLGVIEGVFAEEIRPYIELDEGGVKILDLQNEVELVIAYEGACTSCYSSIGTTLSSIQEILRTKIHPAITVIPNLDALTFSKHEAAGVDAL